MTAKDSPETDPFAADGPAPPTDAGAASPEGHAQRLQALNKRLVAKIQQLERELRKTTAKPPESGTVGPQRQDVGVQTGGPPDEAPAETERLVVLGRACQAQTEELERQVIEVHRAELRATVVAERLKVKNRQLAAGAEAATARCSVLEAQVRDLQRAVAQTAGAAPVPDSGSSQDTTLPPDAVIPEGLRDEVVEGLRREVARLKESEAAAVAHAADLHAQVQALQRASTQMPEAAPALAFQMPSCQDTTLPPDALLAEEPSDDEVVEGLRREVARLREAEAAAVAHAEDPQAQVRDYQEMLERIPRAPLSLDPDSNQVQLLQNRRHSHNDENATGGPQAAQEWSAGVLSASAQDIVTVTSAVPWVDPTDAGDEGCGEDTPAPLQEAFEAVAARNAELHHQVTSLTAQVRRLQARSVARKNTLDADVSYGSISQASLFAPLEADIAAFVAEQEATELSAAWDQMAAMLRLTKDALRPLRALDTKWGPRVECWDEHPKTFADWAQQMAALRSTIQMAVSRVVGPPEKRFSLEPVERRCATLPMLRDHRSPRPDDPGRAARTVPNAPLERRWSCGLCKGGHPGAGCSPMHSITLCSESSSDTVGSAPPSDAIGLKAEVLISQRPRASGKPRLKQDRRTAVLPPIPGAKVLVSCSGNEACDDLFRQPHAFPTKQQGSAAVVLELGHLVRASRLFGALRTAGQGPLSVDRLPECLLRSDLARSRTEPTVCLADGKATVAVGFWEFLAVSLHGQLNIHSRGISVDEWLTFCTQSPSPIGPPPPKALAPVRSPKAPLSPLMQLRSASPLPMYP